MAEEVLAQLARSWPSQKFVPDDPLLIVVSDQPGGEGYLEAVARVMQATLGECPTAGEAEQLLKLTVGEFVDHLFALGARLGKAPADYSSPTDYSQFARFPETSS
jgi:hypothetical protein